MFGNFVQKLQSLSPLGSPITSPVSSPKSRRKFPVKSPRWRRREEYREVQSDPELDERDSAGGKDKRKKCERLYDVPQRRSKPVARTSNGVLQGSKSLGRLDGMREAQRLAQYEHYLQSIVDNTRHDHPDVEDLAVAKAKAKQIVKRGEQESDLERIQDLFPNDCLRLHDKDVLTMKMKGLMRKRSTTAARLQRALSAKALRPGASEGSPEDPENGLPPGKTRKTQQKRQFLMETAVQFTTGVQSQERHLFLFTDLLLVAKARSGGNFKLKEKVRVSEMWLSRCVDDVIEVMKSHDTSFVMGWPTTNVAATFSTQAARDIWWNKLNEVITIERDKEPKSTNIQVLYYDVATNIEYCKTFSIGPSETARSCIRLALDHLEMRGLDPADFQLWAKTGRDESPYPLIGHERPFSIKLSCLRDALSAEEGFDLDHCNNIYGTDPLAKCQFILRNVRKTPECPSSDQKKGKKPRKSPMKIRHVFRRSGSKGEDGVYSSGYLFGVPLTRLCDGDNIPKPVMSMLQQVFMKGPFTQGIFRKSANARLVRELREKMDSTTEDLPLDHVPVLVTAALLKDFLRSLPDPLLVAALYSDWMEAIECSDDKERILRLKAILQQLPKAHQVILQHFLCILHHIALRASENLMSPSNLAVCVGPSLLWVPSLTPASSRAVPALVEILIDRCEELCGPNVVTLMGEPPERDPTRQDSGAEESDSLHSGNSLHSGGLRRDDSSIDSLERELMEPSPLPRKDKMSLSRDSGLTMSDSQLYTPDEEESESTSSGHSGEKSGGQTLYRQAYSDYKSQGYNSCYEHSKITGTFSHPLVTSTPQKQQEMKEYVRVYSGWEERIEGYRKNTDESIYAKTPARLTQSHLGHGQVINPNFQRQDWFRQRSHLKKLSLKQGQYLSSNNDGCVLNQSMSTMHNNKVNTLLRRSASEESLLNSYNVDHLSANPKRPALHRKGRAPAPPPIQRLQESTQQSPRLHNHTNLRHQLIHHYSSIHQPPASMLRSKSAHHLYSGRRDSDEIELLREPLPVVKPHQDQKDWSRSQSTPHIDEVDCSYDSSTLSDDDSTPHVSRSNSRGKDCTAVNTAWESVYGSLGSGSGSQSGTPRSSLSTLETTVAGSTTSSGSGSNAPNYKDTITRRHRHAASDQEQGNLSSRSKQLYEESLRIYGEKKVPVELVHAAPIKVDSQDSDSDHQTPPPLPPKAEAPPLPPKQRLTRRSFPSTTAESGVKLRHLPPVHVNIEGSSPSVPRNKLPRPVSYHADLSFLHTVQRSEPIYAPVPRARRTTLSGGMSTSCATETSYTEHQKVQTDANVEKMKGTSDDCGVKDEGIQTRGWEGSVERKRKDNEAQKSSRSEPKQTEHRSRLRRRDAIAGSAQRSKSLPPSEKTETEEEPPKKEFHERLNLRSEISWSVSQLRTLFGGNSNRKSSGSSGPPPYRPPPSVIRNSRAPITTYHLGNSQSEVYVTKLLDRRHKRCDSTDSNYGEESYV